jgi:hypothetical protein
MSIYNNYLLDMKKLLFSILMVLSVTANDLFLYDSTDKTELSEVVSSKLNVLPTTVGKTYTLTNGLSVVAGTNQTTSYVFPHKIAVYQKESTSVFFNQTPIEYNNTFKLPEVVKFKESAFNFTVDGVLYCVSKCPSQTTIGTPLGFITFTNAKFFVTSGAKYTHVFVIEGTLTVSDTKSKKKKQLKADDYLVITPQTILSPREGTISNLGNSFSIKEVEDTEKDVHVKEIQTLSDKLNNVLFINNDVNIFGVKLN